MRTRILLIALCCFFGAAFAYGQTQPQTRKPQQTGEFFIGYPYPCAECDKRRKEIGADNLAFAQVVFTDRILQRYKDPEEGNAKAKKLQLDLMTGSLLS